MSVRTRGCCTLSTCQIFRHAVLQLIDLNIRLTHRSVLNLPKTEPCAMWPDTLRSAVPSMDSNLRWPDEGVGGRENACAYTAASLNVYDAHGLMLCMLTSMNW